MEFFTDGQTKTARSNIILMLAGCNYFWVNTSPAVPFEGSMGEIVG
jgi:hypothetical protein